MKRLIWIAAFALMVAGCASTSSTTVIPTIVLDGGNASPAGSSSDNGDSISALAIVVPVKYVRLSFASSGRVTAVNAAAGDTVKAGDVLVTLDTAILEAKVREAEANLAAAEAQVRFLKRNKTDAVHLETAQADVDRAQALVDLAKATLEAQSGLTAPFDGTIVTVDIAPSETVAPGQTVIVLADFSSFQIETTDLSELDVTRVQVGQPVVIFIEALGKEFNGEVKEVSLTSSTLGGEVVYAVTISLDSQPDGLLWGMSADVQIQTGG
jgi:RND family efflux transporter MFP subunit